MSYSPDDHPRKRRRTVGVAILVAAIGFVGVLIAATISSGGRMPWVPEPTPSPTYAGPVGDYSRIFAWSTAETTMESEGQHFVRDEGDESVDVYIDWTVRDGNNVVAVGVCNLLLTIESFQGDDILDDDFDRPAQRSNHCSTRSEDMMEIYGSSIVFQDLPPGHKYQVMIEDLDQDNTGIFSNASSGRYFWVD